MNNKYAQDMEAVIDRVTAERDTALNDAESLRESLRTQTLIINSIANARDTALGREARAKEGLAEHRKVVCDQRAKIDSLQKRLTAADERADHWRSVASEATCRAAGENERANVLEGLLRRVVDSSVLSFEQDAPEELELLEADICAVLKSAEVALQPLELEGGHFEGHFPPGAYMALPLGSTFTIIPADNGNKMCDFNQGRIACNGQCKATEGGGDEYRKSCEAAHKALSMENQQIVAPGQFKCLACGGIHPGSGNLPCPKMSPTA